MAISRNSSGGRREVVPSFFFLEESNEQLATDNSLSLPGYNYQRRQKWWKRGRVARTEEDPTLRHDKRHGGYRTLREQNCRITFPLVTYLGFGNRAT